MYSHEIEVLIGKVAKLCYKISAETNTDAFFDYSGHCDFYGVNYHEGGYDNNKNPDYINQCDKANADNLRETLQKLTVLYTEEKAKMKGETK